MDNTSTKTATVFWVIHTLKCMHTYIHAYTHTHTHREDLPLFIFGNKHGTPPSKGWDDLAGVDKVIGEFWNMMGPVGEILGLREYEIMCMCPKV